MCDGYRAAGLSACPGCGADISAPRTDDKDGGAVFWIGVVIVAICAAVLVFEAAAAFILSGEVFSNLIDYAGSLILLVPTPVRVLSISGVFLQGYYVLLLAAMALSVGWILFKAYRALRPGEGGRRDRIRNTALFEMAVLFAALYIVEIVFILAVNAAGVETDSPIDGDAWTLAYSLLAASVWEEVISRMLLIGVPMLVAALLMNDRGIRLRRYLLGGFGMSRGALVLILLSALVFGYAHVPGWDLWKLFPTFLFGLIAGYLFVKYGIYAAIAIHFLTDYLLSSDWVFGDGGTYMSLAMLAVMLLGIPYVWVYTKRGLLFLRDSVSGRTSGA